VALRQEMLMKQSLMELVDVILQRIEERHDSAPSETGIRSWLLRQGYNKRDIDAAMRLVRSRIASNLPVERQRPDSLRQLSVWERFKLTSEARDALVRLDLYELISAAEREMILDQLAQFDGEVGLAELDYLVSWVCGDRNVESQQTLFTVIEGNGENVH